MFFILGDRGVQSWPVGEGVGRGSLLNARLTAVSWLPCHLFLRLWQEMAPVLSSGSMLGTERDRQLPTGHFVALN